MSTRSIPSSGSDADSTAGSESHSGSASTTANADCGPHAAQATQPNIHVIVSRMFGQNCYIASWPQRTDCLVIDPGFDTRQILDYLLERRLTPAAILNTHGHIDHIAGNEALKRQWPACPIVIGADEADKLTDPMRNLSGLYDSPIVSPPADQLLADGEQFSAAGFVLLTRAIPGHSSGHVVFLWRAERPWLVFGGDVLFQGSVGRTDFPDGDFDLLAAGIREKLYVLPADTIVYPGHGPTTTIGQERQFNPFVRAVDCD